MKLYSQMKSLAKVMKIKYEEVTKEIEHRGEKGTMREEIIRKFLESYLPDKYGVRRGIIICAAGIQSKQQDIIIVDKNVTPKFVNFDDVDVVPVESARVIVEVKSVLTTTELEKALVNIASVRSMQKTICNKNIVSKYPFGIIFAYESSITLERIKEEMIKYSQENNIQDMPTLVVVLNRGYISCANKNKPLNYELIPCSNTIFGVHKVDDEADNLMILFIMVITGLFSANMLEIQPDIAEYALNSGFANPSKTFIEEDYKGVTMEMEGMSVNLDKMRTFQKEFAKLPKEKRLSAEGLAMMIESIEKCVPGFDVDWDEMRKVVKEGTADGIIEIKGKLKGK